MKKSLTLPMNKVILCIILCTSGVVLYCVQSPQIQITVFILQFLLTAILAKFEFGNPLVWYLGAFTIYSIGYPLLYVFGINTSRGFSVDPLRWCWIAYFIFVLFFNSKDNDCSEQYNKTYYWVNKDFYRLFIMVSGLFVLSSALIIRKSGYHNKGEIYSEGNVYVNFAFSLIYIIHTIYVYLMQINHKTNNKKDNIRLIVFVGFISMLLAMFSGERDILLRFFVITIFSLYLNKVINKKGFSLLLVALVIVLPITGIFKYHFLSSELGNIYQDFTFKSIVSSLFVGEFESASKNLQMLANDKINVLGCLGGRTYISDITRIIGYAPNSALRWFNSKYYSGSKIGHGFTIVGEGLLNFGIVGIVFNFIIIGISMSWFYRNRYKSETLMTIYILLIPIMVYSVRADFANILSPLFRQILVPLYIFNFFVNNGERKVSNEGQSE